MVGSNVATDCTDWRRIPINADFVLTGLKLEDGKPYFLHVKAQNTVGLSSTGTSLPFYVDTQPPLASRIRDGACAGTSLSVLTSTTSPNYAVCFAPFTSRSGIASYSGCLRLASASSCAMQPLSPQIMGSGDLQVSLPLVITNHTLLEGDRIVAVISAMSFTGLGESERERMFCCIVC